MNKKFKIGMYSAVVLFFLIGIFLFNFISAIQITQLNNSLDSENLSFMGDQNITRYIELPRYANVTSAYMNLSGYLVPEGTYTGDSWYAVDLSDFKAVAANDTSVWIVSTTNEIYKFNSDGTYANEHWNATTTDCSSISDITTNGSSLWVVDWENNETCELYINGTYTENHWDSPFTYFSGYDRGVITQNGTYIWIGDMSNYAVKKYHMNGTYTGDYWASGTYISGIATDSDYIWITSSIDKEVYKYHMNGTNTGEHWDTAGDGVSTEVRMTISGNYILIIDKNYNKIFKYDKNGVFQNSWHVTGMGDTEIGYGEPWDIDTDGTYIWILDSDNYHISKYYMNGTLINDWLGTSIISGIATNGTYIWTSGWIATNKIYKHYMNGTYTNDSWTALSYMGSLTIDNEYIFIAPILGNQVYKYYLNGTDTGINFSTYGYGMPWGITTDGNYMWVTNITAYKVYKYYMNGTYTGDFWNVTTTSLSGITQDGTYFWITDSITANVRKYYMSVFYLESPWLEVGTPDGIHEWNHSGEFNSTFSPNKTSDLSSAINAALNDGACDCTGCSLDGVNCSIPLVFHSDIAGDLEYSTIEVDYDPIPYVYLVSPVNDTVSPATKTFNCSATDEIQLANMTFYFWNSTGDLNLSTTIDLTGTSNFTTYEMTFNSTEAFTWGCSATNNGSYVNWAEDNYTINVDIDNPIIILEYPTDDIYLSAGDNLYFNYTPEHSTQTVETCQLWGNFTGSWDLNLTNSTNIVEDITNSFIQNVTSENRYDWTVWCNTTMGNSAYSQNGNFTFFIDLTNPLLVINTITTIDGNQSVVVNTTSSDNMKLDTCRYVVYTLAGGVDSSKVFTCNSDFTATVSSYATFNMTVIVNDSAGHENITSALFTTRAIVPPGPGGGGGGAPIIIIPGDMEWTLETEGAGTRYQFNMIQGSARIKDLLFENIGTSSPQIRLHCEESSDSLNLCDYIKFEETSFYLPLQKDIKHAISFNVIIPKDLKKGDYIGNIIATDDKNNIAVLTVEVNLETFGFITKIITKMGSSKIMGNVKIPYFFIFLFSVLILGFTSSYFFKKIKMPGGLGLIVGLVGGLALLLIV